MSSLILEPREPRCRVCRHPDVRRLVNDLLAWRGVPVRTEGGRPHRVSLTDILRTLEPLNEGRYPRDRITYDSLWVHAKRHNDLDGLIDYWTAQMDKKLRNAFSG